MDKKDISDYMTRDGCAQVLFRDDSHFVLKPKWNFHSVVGFDAALVYKDGTLEAALAENSNRTSETGRLEFWSHGIVMPGMLMHYWRQAQLLGEDIKKDHAHGKISYRSWLRLRPFAYIIAMTGNDVVADMGDRTIVTSSRKPDRFPEPYEWKWP
jgi:hypothetical protein